MADIITIVNNRNKKQNTALEAKGYVLVDITARSKDDVWKRFSPNFPHGDIPVPGLNTVSLTVDGLWEGLKTFKDGTGVDTAAFRSKTAGKRKYGELHGKTAHRVRTHVLNTRARCNTKCRAGVKIGDAIETDELVARRSVFVPAYEWVLENKLRREVDVLLGYLSGGRQIALIDMPPDGTRFSHATILRDRLLKLHAARPVVACEKPPVLPGDVPVLPGDVPVLPGDVPVLPGDVPVPPDITQLAIENPADAAIAAADAMDEDELLTYSQLKAIEDEVAGDPQVATGDRSVAAGDPVAA